MDIKYPLEIYCSVCRERIARVTPSSTLRYPLVGHMFQSPDPEHGFPAPFPDPNVTWVDMQCPWGPHRPFFRDDEILTDQGVFTVMRDGSLLPEEETPLEYRDPGRDCVIDREAMDRLERLIPDDTPLMEIFQKLTPDDTTIIDHGEKIMIPLNLQSDSMPCPICGKIVKRMGIGSHKRHNHPEVTE